MRGAAGAGDLLQPAVCAEEAGGAAPQRGQAGGGHVLVPQLLRLPDNQDTVTSGGKYQGQTCSRCLTVSLLGMGAR